MILVLGFTAFRIDVGIDLDPWRVVMIAFLAHEVARSSFHSLRSNDALLPSELKWVIGLSSLSLIIGVGVTSANVLPGIRGSALYPIVALGTYAIAYLWYAFILRYIRNDLTSKAIKVLGISIVALSGLAVTQFVALGLGLRGSFLYGGTGRSAPISTAVAGLPRATSATAEPRELAFFLLPATIGLAYYVFSERSFRGRKIAGIMLTLAGLGLFFTFSRIYLWSLVAAIVLVLPWAFRAERDARVGRRTRALGRFVAVVVVLGGAMGLLNATGVVPLRSVGQVLGSAQDFNNADYQPNAMVSLEWRLFRTHPFFGVGPGRVRQVFANERGQDFSVSAYPAVSWYLGTLAEFGLVGFLALMVFLLRVYQRFKQGLRKSSSHRDRRMAIALMAGALSLLLAHVLEPGPAPLTLMYLALAIAVCERSGGPTEDAELRHLSSAPTT
jgi:O-antigen ligase